MKWNIWPDTLHSLQASLEQPQQFHATSVATNILNNNTKIYSAPTFGKGFPLDYFHSHQSFIQHPLAVINKPIETSTFHPNPPQKKESKKKIILLRVIPTMTCRVGVVRWGLVTVFVSKASTCSVPAAALICKSISFSKPYFSQSFIAACMGPSFNAFEVWRGGRPW